MSNPTWQDITPQREIETPCTGEPCTNPEHDHEAAPVAEWDWAELGRILREIADDAHEITPDVRISYSFLLDNPECFGFEEWPGDMPQEPNIELVAAYYKAYDALPICPNCGEPATFTEHAGDFTETHGLDCGPYETWHEEWVTCNKCGANTDEAEINAAQPKEAL